MVADAGEEPGALPLLSTALTELWEQRSGDRLTLAAYVGGGGLRGAVARLAERAYADLPDEDRAAARALLLRLAGPGEGERTSRRRAALAELDSLPDPRVRAVVDPLVRARLLTVGAGHVEVAHEALFREWPRLREWLAADADARAVQRRLVAAAQEWAAGGREEVDLWRGARLAAASDFLLAHPDEVTQTERSFVERGVAREDAESREVAERAAAAASQNVRLRRLVGVIGVLLVLALVAGTLAVQARTRAEREAAVATSRGLAGAAMASTGTDGELAVLLAVESVRQARPLGGTALREAENALHAAIASSRIDQVVPGAGGQIDVSPDGRTFAALGAWGSGRIEVREVASGAQVRGWVAHDGEVTSVRYGSDGTVLATGGGGGVARVWDARDGRLLHELAGDPASVVRGVSLSPDGRLLAGSWVGDEDLVMVRDIATGAVVLQVDSTPEDGESATTTAFSPDGSRVATTVDGVTRVIDLATGATVFDLVVDAFSMLSIQWSPDGSRIATGGADDDVRVWDARTGEQELALAHGANVWAVAWDAGGTQLAAGGTDGVTRVWDLTSPDRAQEVVLSALSTRTGVIGVDFTTDGSRLLTGDVGTGPERHVTSWDLGPAGTAEHGVYPVAGRGYSGLDWTDDGRVLVQGTGSGAATFRDVASGRVLKVLGPHEGMPADAIGAVYGLDVSEDGTLVAVTGGDDTVTAWDVGTGDELFSVGTNGWADSLEWTPDGRHLAVSTWGRNRPGGSVVVLDLTGGVVAELRASPGELMTEVDVGPDGRIVVVDGEFEGYRSTPIGATVWDWRTDRVVEVIEGDFTVAQLSPHGDRLALASRTSVAVREMGTGEELVATTAFSSIATDLAWTPDGDRLITSHDDGEVRVWDAGTGELLLVLQGHDGTVQRVTVDPDGSVLASSAGYQLARLWALDLDDLLELARGEVTRPLTDQECREHLDADTCPGTAD